MLNSINFVVLGDPSIASRLGLKGTATDIVIYDRKTADTVYTWTTPVTFPDKIQPLLQAVNIAEYAILNVTRFDKFLGEQVMAFDSLGLSDGFVMHSNKIDREKLRTVLKGASIANYQFVDSVDHLKQEMGKLQPKGSDGRVVIPIDHVFEVKSVGTIVLGVVKQGTVKAYYELVLLPCQKKVLVKSIQIQSDPVESSSSPSRVGLAIKRHGRDEISRIDVICAPDTLKVTSIAISVRFAKSSFFKGDLAENHTYMVSVGMQVKTAKIRVESENILQVIPEKPLVYTHGQTVVFLKPDSQGNRIAGKWSM